MTFNFLSCAIVFIFLVREITEPGGNLHRHRENMQTPQKGPVLSRNRTTNLLANKISLSDEFLQFPLIKLSERSNTY